MRGVDYIPPVISVLRITPHRNIANSATKNLYASLYEVFDVKTGGVEWSIRRPLYIAYRDPRPHLWWVMRMAVAEDGARSIEFFVAMPTDLVDPFKTKFRNHPKWGSSTIEEVEDFDHGFDHTISDLYRIKYTHHDIFSLEVNHSYQTSPVRELMNVIDEMNGNEAINIYFRSQAVGRGVWQKLAEYAWEQWGKGGMPYRVGFSPVRLVHNVAVAATQVVYSIGDLKDDIMSAVQNIFFHEKAEQVARSRPQTINKDREAMLINGDLSNPTKRKRHSPVFATDIRMVVQSKDPVRRNMLARSIGVAYNATAGDNRLQSIKIGIRGKKELDNIICWDVVGGDPNRMSIEELAQLHQLPTADLQREYADALHSNGRVETALPDVFLDPSGIVAGTATDRGATHQVHIPVTDRDFLFTGRSVVGSPRMGKDQHIINLVVEAKRRHGIGAIIPDVVNERNGHRGMADAIRDHLSPEDVLDFDLGDTNHPIYLGLEAIVKGVADQRIAADRVAEEITEFLLADGDADKFQTATYLREAAKAANGDMMGIKLMFTSETYRRAKIKELDGTFDMNIWRAYDALKEGQQNQLFAPIMRRLNQMESEVLKPIFFQTPNPAMDLHKWMSEGKVVIFRIPNNGAISERAVQILVYWIVLTTFLTSMSLGGNGPGAFLVLNEPHQFLSPGLVHFMERLLAEGPKYRLAPIFLFHFFAQFKKYPGFVDMMLAASMNWHIFKNTNSKVYDQLMPYLGGTFASAQDAFEATKRFQYIACWLNSMGEYEPPFVADALPMVGDRYESRANARLTAECSRRFGRPIREVLDSIRDRNKLMWQ